MKRIILSLALLFTTTAVLFADDAKKDELENGKYYLKGITGLNLSQTSFTNWSAGGDNSFAGNLYLNGTLTRRSGNWLWDNNLAVEYGLTNTKSKGTQKAQDRIELGTQLGYSTNQVWYYTVAADFKTQFYKGYNYPNKERYISKFMAPGYLNVSAGIEYRPKSFFSVYFSPVAGKMTFVRDRYLSDLGAFGVDKGDRFRAEMGALLKAKAEKEIMENIKAITSVDFFTAYDKSFGNVDVNWDFMLSMKVNKFISATLSTSLKYDDDVKRFDTDGNKIGGAKVQFKEVLGAGLAINF